MTDNNIPKTSADFIDRENLDRNVEAALSTIEDYGQIDGDHHKAWVIDKVVRALTGDKYEAFVQWYQYGDNDVEALAVKATENARADGWFGEDESYRAEDIAIAAEDGYLEMEYDWDEGIAP